MGREVDVRLEAELAATPEEVWDAIATGPGIDSWFMGRTEVEPGAGGSVRTAFGAYDPRLRISGWEPGEWLAYGGEREADGRFIAYEFLIEGRGRGSTVLRMVTSGFLPGDDWAEEYESMGFGLALFFRTLIEYLAHFPGRTAAPVTAFGPPVDDWERAWSALRGELGLENRPTAGDKARVALDGPGPVEGVVYHVSPQTLGIRAADGLYRFVRGLGGSIIAMHHLFSPSADAAGAQQAWSSWLARIVREER